MISLKVRRRRLLLALGATGAAVAAGAAVGPATMRGTAKASIATPGAARGYRVTEHIRNYYNSTGR